MSLRRKMLLAVKRQKFLHRTKNMLQTAVNKQRMWRGKAKSIYDLIEPESNPGPYLIHQTGPCKVTKRLKNLFKHNEKMLGLESKFYSDADCKRFIKNNFPSDVFFAYDSLIPGAFKADFFRYCIIYKKGGVYLDLTHKVIEPYDFRSVDLVLVKDRGSGVQTSFMWAKPNLNLFRFVIAHVSYSILRREKGRDALDITGPVKFSYLFFKFFKIPFRNGDIRSYFGLDEKEYTIKRDMFQVEMSSLSNSNGPVILKRGLGEESHLKLMKNGGEHYIHAWNNNRIYKN